MTVKKLKRSEKWKLPGKRPLVFTKSSPSLSLPRPFLTLPLSLSLSHFLPFRPKQILRDAHLLGAIYEIVLRQSYHTAASGINGDCQQYRGRSRGLNEAMRPAYFDSLLEMPRALISRNSIYLQI